MTVGIAILSILFCAQPAFSAVVAAPVPSVILPANLGILGAGATDLPIRIEDVHVGAESIQNLSGLDLTQSQSVSVVSEIDGVHSALPETVLHRSENELALPKSVVQIGKKARRGILPGRSALRKTSDRSALKGALPDLEGLSRQVQDSGEGDDPARIAALIEGFFDQANAKADDAAGPDSGEADVEYALSDDGFNGRFRVAYDPDGEVDLSERNTEPVPAVKLSKKEAKKLGKKKAKKLAKQDAKELSEKEARKLFDEDQKALELIQRKLYAEGARSVLIVLQAMDTGGKDGTIREVLYSINPQGLKITSFKKPSDEEKKQHYLRRIIKALPGKGMIGIFNRSHHEDLIVPAVYGTLPAVEIERRYEEINAFEKMLAQEGTVILKFFLHISKAEQKRRLQERLDDPDKNWKFSFADLASRERWDDFQKAYGKDLARTSTPWAPWNIIPADKKWYRDYVVGRILLRALERMDPHFPRPDFDPKTIVIPD